ncbi:LOW QUALITY PROTEIN: hypothetical protein CVT26_009073 [Gymnopilus dilepis]|uniref:Uncharacterized protein n=1 Tax=Gymnopilus dilepis TaxID=231916 RepID=A0A409YR40_9AGAR|nr:LOW QUALITY PROTEIN: hypothetical protein CVT26_009073 [Gymnopilus dilepis]
MYEDHSLWESFPDVRCLKIIFERRESREVADEVLGNLMSSVLRKWPKQLNLRSLIIEFAFDDPWKEAFILNLQKQRQWLLDVVSAQFPALHSCRFDMAFWWRYDLVKEKRHPEANPEFCGTLLEFLKAADYKEGDCEGFLENLVNASVDFTWKELLLPLGKFTENYSAV